jgi:hypothetical protein
VRAGIVNGKHLIANSRNTDCFSIFFDFDWLSDL